MIIGILLMLMVLPLLTYSEIDFSSEYGLRELFWFGRSSCDKNEPDVDGTLRDFFCSEEAWITTDGWHELLRQYTRSSSQGDTSEVTKTLLWLYVPDFLQKGTLSDIKSIPSQTGDSTYWSQTSSCAGFEVNDSCPWRYEELELVTFIPIECTERHLEGCD
jgi:hypothetical protein